MDTLQSIEVFSHCTFEFSLMVITQQLKRISPFHGDSNINYFILIILNVNNIFNC